METVLKRELIFNKHICRVCLVFFAVVFMGLGVLVRIPLPFTPVPVTLQTFFLLLCAGLLGSRLGIIAQSSYVLLGVLGLPVFAGSVSGPGYLLSPTAGYLWGFILATLFIAKFIRLTKDNLFLVIPVFFAGSMIILFCGSIWLKAILGVSLAQALALGFLPFMGGDLLKVVAAAFIYRKLKGRISEII